MTVKDKTGRSRYILFGITLREGADGVSPNEDSTDMFYFGRKHLNRELEDFLKRIEREAKISPGVLFMDGNLGIFRCSHRHVRESLDLLNGLEIVAGKEVRVATIQTSGTVKKVKGRMKKLLELRKRLSEQRDSSSASTNDNNGSPPEDGFS